MPELGTVARLDLRGETITTHIVHVVDQTLTHLAEGDRVELKTDAYPAIENDVRAWSSVTGNPLVEVEPDGPIARFVIEKGRSTQSDHKFTAETFDDGAPPS